MPSADPTRRHVFISYTRADRSWVDRLQRMMAPLLRNTDQELKLWDDSQIEPGAKWRQAIETALQQAQVALLLVSDAFLASEFVMNEEVPRLLAAAEAEGVRILWVSLSPCLVEHTPIHEYQAVLPLDHYLEELSGPQQQRALKTIAETVRDALGAPLPSAARAPEPVPLPAPDPEPDPRPAALVWQPLSVDTAQLQQVAGQWRLERRQLQLKSAAEELGEGVSLRLLPIPAGQFLMGSPADEPERSQDEGPQQLVQLEAFLMGQTPITQAQWRAVAEWQPRAGESWGRQLKPFPAAFADRSDSDQRPVECVSWFEAMEFCNRLSQLTGRKYTLPSEAQWEYACRAGTTTPFTFGETISPQLANYNGNYSYTNGPTGNYLDQTTPVGQFPANAWGLQDMHGNVWEWCLDEWHDSHQGAPADGSAWAYDEDLYRSDNHKRRMERGGSWREIPKNCRSACRPSLGPGVTSFDVGFRVVCLPHGHSPNEELRMSQAALVAASKELSREMIHLSTNAEARPRQAPTTQALTSESPFSSILQPATQQQLPARHHPASPEEHLAELTEAINRGDQQTIRANTDAQLKITIASENAIALGLLNKTQLEEVTAGGGYLLAKIGNGAWPYPTESILKSLAHSQPSKGIFHYCIRSISKPQIIQPARLATNGSNWIIAEMGSIALPG